MVSGPASLDLRPESGTGSVALAGEIGGPSGPSEPKAQPPRKRSGKRTARTFGRWKVAQELVPGARRRSKVTTGGNASDGTGISQASGQRGREDGGAFRFNTRL